jgi:hypothetical protein
MKLNSEENRATSLANKFWFSLDRSAKKEDAAETWHPKSLLLPKTINVARFLKNSKILF